MTAGLDSDEVIDLTSGSGRGSSKREAESPVLEAFPTVLDDLKQALSKASENPALTLRVPARPTLDLVFNPNIEYGVIRRFFKQAEGKDGVNQLKMAYMVIAWANTGIRVRGVLATDSEGNDMSVKNHEFQRMLESRDTQDCIYRLYGEKAGEGHVINVADRILEEAGYGDPRSIGLDPLDA